MSKADARTARKQIEPRDPQETLAFEARWLRPAGWAALFAGVLPLIATIVQVIVLQDRPDDVRTAVTSFQALDLYAAGDVGAGIHGLSADFAIFRGEQVVGLAITDVLPSLGILAAAPAIYFLMRAGWRRRPAFPGWLLWMPLVGGVVYGVGNIAAQVYYGIQFADFLDLPEALQTNAAADDVFSTLRDAPGLQVPVQLGMLFFSVSLAVAAITGMSVGLITRFMGIMGIAVVILPVLFQADSEGFLQSFWLIALAVLLLRTGPTVRPAAWGVGEAVPWPTRAEQIEQAERERNRRRAEEAAANEPAPKPKAKTGQGGKRRKRRK
ncbi:MAG: hypothetical protein M0P31_16155 [Solirubrobacteraceae bacterium]|nr:hypothetical protein [Solirubrobacteraceae bacterium]